MANGRVQDVLIEDVYYTDERTGVRSISNKSITVWADKGVIEIIKRVEGVSGAYVFSPTRYSVYIDPRYDIAFVKREIEAAILCGE